MWFIYSFIGYVFIYVWMNISHIISNNIYIWYYMCVSYLSTISPTLPGTTHPRRTKLRPAAANSSFSVGCPWRSRASDGGFHGHGVSKKGWFIINGKCHEHWWFGGRPISEKTTIFDNLYKCYLYWILGITWDRMSCNHATAATSYRLGCFWDHWKDHWK